MLNQFLYLDNILFVPQIKQDYVQHVCEVFQRLLVNNLYVKVEKREVYRCTIFFSVFTGSQPVAAALHTEGSTADSGVR